MGIMGGSGAKGKTGDDQAHRTELRHLNEEIQITQGALTTSTRERDGFRANIAKFTADKRKVEQELLSLTTDIRKLEDTLKKKTAEMVQKKRGYEQAMASIRTEETKLKEKDRRHLILEGEMKKLQKKLRD